MSVSKFVALFKKLIPVTTREVLPIDYHTGRLLYYIDKDAVSSNKVPSTPTPSKLPNTQSPKPPQKSSDEPDLVKENEEGGKVGTIQAAATDASPSEAVGEAAKAEPAEVPPRTEVVQALKELTPQTAAEPKNTPAPPPPTPAPRAAPEPERRLSYEERRNLARAQRSAALRASAFKELSSQERRNIARAEHLQRRGVVQRKSLPPSPSPPPSPPPPAPRSPEVNESVLDSIVKRFVGRRTDLPPPKIEPPPPNTEQPSKMEPATLQFKDRTSSDTKEKHDDVRKKEKKDKKTETDTSGNFRRRANRFFDSIRNAFKKDK